MNEISKRKWLEVMERSYNTQKIINKMFPEIKVKNYKIKSLCNKIFRTHFKLWNPDPNAEAFKYIGTEVKNCKVLREE